MNWLVINREPVTLADLQANLVTELPKPKLMTVVESFEVKTVHESYLEGVKCRAFITDI